jgi:15-cis-phytoene synthase
LDEGLAADFAECRRLVDESDADRAVSLAYAPDDRRNALAALYAFDIETRRIRAQVSQPLPGEIRLQWWRDRLANPQDEGQGAPVAHALLDTIQRYDLPRDAFERYLEARIFDLYDDPMPGQAEFEAYAGETASTIIMLAAMILGGRPDTVVADAAGHAGVATLAAGLLRREPQLRRLGQNYVPGDLLSAAGADHAGWASGPDGLQAARLALAAYAQDHLKAVTGRLSQIPPAIRPAFLPALANGAALRMVERRGGLPYVESRFAAMQRLWSYWRAMRA